MEISIKVETLVVQPLVPLMQASHTIGKAACIRVVKFVFLITTFLRASKNIRKNLVNNSYPLQP